MNKFKLNSPTRFASDFEDKFQLNNFECDYLDIVIKLNKLIQANTNSGEYASFIYSRKIFRKLCYFIDDFNYFIKSSLSENFKYPFWVANANIKNQYVFKRSTEFKRRAKNLQVPTEYKKEICYFISKTTDNFQRHNTEEEKVKQQYTLYFAEKESKLKEIFEKLKEIFESEFEKGKQQDHNLAFISTPIKELLFEYFCKGVRLNNPPVFSKKFSKEEIIAMIPSVKEAMLHNTYIIDEETECEYICS